MAINTGKKSYYYGNDPNPVKLLFDQTFTVYSDLPSAFAAMRWNWRGDGWYGWPLEQPDPSLAWINHTRDFIDTLPVGDPVREDFAAQLARAEEAYKGPYEPDVYVVRSRTASIGPGSGTLYLVRELVGVGKWYYQLYDNDPWGVALTPVPPFDYEPEPAPAPAAPAPEPADPPA